MDPAEWALALPAVADLVALEPAVEVVHHLAELVAAHELVLAFAPSVPPSAFVRIPARSCRSFGHQLRAAFASAVFARELAFGLAVILAHLVRRHLEEVPTF